MRAHNLNHYCNNASCSVAISRWAKDSISNCVLFAFFLFSSIFAYAQPKFKVFDTEFGLSDNIVSSIAQDQQGYLWVGTEDGLNRFDGYSFKVYKYNPNEKNSIASNQISCLAVDNSNRIWIGHSSSVTRYDPSLNAFTQYKIDKTDSTAVCWISFIWIDKNDRVWLSVVGSGLMVLNPETGKIEKRIAIDRFMENNFNIAGMAEDSKGNVWLATQVGLYVYDRKLDAVKLAPNVNSAMIRNGNFKAILSDKNNDFWLASYSEGICHYAPDKNSFITFKDESALFDANLMLDIAWKNEKEFWLISRDKGRPIGSFNTQTKAFTYLKLPAFLDGGGDVHAPFTDVFVDRNGVGWVASKIGLVMINPGSSFDLKQIFEAETSIKIRDIVEDTVTQKKFLASDRLGLIVTSLKESTKGRSFDAGLDGVQDLLNTSGDSLWVISLNQVRLFDKVSEKWIDSPELQRIGSQVNTVNPYFKKIIKTSAGDYWVITHDQGAYYLRATPLTIKYLVPDAKSSNSICSKSFASLLEDNFGRIWFASHDAGICIYDPIKNTFNTLNNDRIKTPFLPTNDVYDMDMDNEGNIWLATLEAGIVKINIINKDSTSLTIFDQDVLTSGIDELKIDKKGRVWFRKLNGAYVLDPKTMNIKSFEKESGLLDLVDYNLIESNNRVLLNGSTGLALIDEKYLMPDTAANPFVVNSIKIFGREIYPEGENKDQINLPYDQNSIAIDFAAIDFLHNKKIRYSYKLEGLEKSEWTTSSVNRSTEFAHLAGGDYVFKLRASNQEGIWSKEKNLLYIHIETPFWKTKWFYALVVLVFLGLIALLYYYQLNRNKRISQLQLKALHTQMRPHFIFNCLSAINGQIIKSETVKASEFLTKFSRLMRGILENSTESWITLEQEIETLKLYLVMEGLRFDDRFSYKIDVEQGVDPSKTLIPSMILQPYVENAIGHGLLHKDGPGTVSIKFLKGEGNLKCIIEDNGIGRERSGQMKQLSKTERKSLGLQITSERLHLLQGSVGPEFEDLKNEAGEPTGTRVIVMLMTKTVGDKNLTNLN